MECFSSEKTPKGTEQGGEGDCPLRDGARNLVRRAALW